MFSEKLIQWFKFGDRGASSNTIVEVIEGLPAGMLTSNSGRSHPHDPADFIRCVKLIEEVPEYKEKLRLVRRVSPTWSALIDNWEELELLLEAELPTKRCPLLLNRMQEIIRSSGGGF
jgi:hypothetical protein